MDFERELLGSSSPIAAEQSPFIGSLPENDIVETIRAEVAKTMAEFNVSALGLSVIYNNKPILCDGFGLRDIERSMHATNRTLFQLGSVTKTFTALLAMSLTQDGIVDLSAPVRTLFPSFALKDAFASETVALADLLSHRTGMPA